MAGRLFVSGLSDSGPWDPEAILYTDESIVRVILEPNQTIKKADTAEELQQVILESLRGLPVIRVFVREELGEMVQKYRSL